MKTKYIIHVENKLAMQSLLQEWNYSKLVLVSLSFIHCLHLPWVYLASKFWGTRPEFQYLRKHTKLFTIT